MAPIIWGKVGAVQINVGIVSLFFSCRSSRSPKRWPRNYSLFRHASFGMEVKRLIDANMISHGTEYARTWEV